jgi:hypothetical protein
LQNKKRTERDVKEPNSDRIGPDNRLKATLKEINCVSWERDEGRGPVRWFLARESWERRVAEQRDKGKVPVSWFPLKEKETSEGEKEEEEERSGTEPVR